jgi:tRNA pseudouridine38-40 synthase
MDPVSLSRIAIGIQYMGANYAGWQSQLHQNTVQDCLESAISKFLGKSNQEKIRVVVAGRTDSGVHALGQVAHFDTLFQRDMSSWVSGVNAFLPKDIAIHWAKNVSLDFDARFSAQERAYTYVLAASPQYLPILRGQSGQLTVSSGKSLDIKAMQSAVKHLIGTHDFSSFRSSDCQSKTPIKTIYQLEIVDEPPFIYFFIRGNAFLHHMIRNLIGSLVKIGIGKESPDWMLAVLNAKDRNVAAPTFAPDGLYFSRVGYPDRFEIPEPNLAGSIIPKKLIDQVFNGGNWIKGGS